MQKTADEMRISDWSSDVCSYDLLAILLGSDGTVPLGALRFHAFMDNGYAGIHQPLLGQERNWLLSTVGAGARVKLFNYFNGAVDLGTPLVSGPDSKSGSLFARFRIWGEF